MSITDDDLIAEHNRERVIVAQERQALAAEVDAMATVLASSSAIPVLSQAELGRLRKAFVRAVSALVTTWSESA